MSVAEHLAEGGAHVCRAWAVVRTDGVSLGFTDHDRDLEFDGIRFAADSGLTATALEQSTGLSVDNSEAIGALSSLAISEEDIAAGRYDGAEVVSWLVRWDNVSEREMTFRGHIGSITREGGAFTAELRGMTDRLNQPGGRVFQRSGPTDLAAYGVDVEDPAWSAEAEVVSVQGAEVTVSLPEAFAAGFFARGALVVLGGDADGLSAHVRRDRGAGRLELWERVRGLAEGDRVRLTAGFDGRFASWMERFGDATDFRGFPHIPGEDFLMSVPRRDGINDGGSLNR